MGEVSIRTFRKARFTGAMGTIGIALLLFLVLFLIRIITPIPPYPEGGGGYGMGLEVNLGSSETGLGEIQQADITMPSFVNEKVAASSSINQDQSEKILTQDVEETASLPESQTIENKQQQKNIVTTNKTNTTGTSEQTTTKPVDEKQPEVNQNALYKKFNTTTTVSTNQGITSGSGDQGDPNGRQGSTTYGPGGGTGNGSGNGTGDGIGDGSGPSFSLENRNPISLPKPAYNTQESGKVVVEIYVDREGKVTNAIAGVKGSTTLDTYLLSVAKQAALQARFNRKPDAAASQKGTITYYFVLQ